MTTTQPQKRDLKYLLFASSKDFYRKLKAAAAADSRTIYGYVKSPVFERIYLASFMKD